MSKLAVTIPAPFTVYRDSREWAKWRFEGLRANADRGHAILEIPVEYHNLGSGMGDYTIAGMEDPETGWRISIERKSIADLFSTILGQRERFVTELENLNRMECAAVVVEADWMQIVTYEAQHWREYGLNEKEKEHRRKSLVRSIIAWRQRYPNVDWWFMPSRRAAEVMCFRILERWWTDTFVKEHK